MMMQYLTGYRIEGALDEDRGDINAGDIEEKTWLDMDILDGLSFDQAYLDNLNT